MAQGTLIRNVRLMDPFHRFDQRTDVLISPEVFELEPTHIPEDARVLDGKSWVACPGLIDLHVHFREPGFEHKETLETGSVAALAGGVTTVVVMPNTRPVLDTAERVKNQIQRSKEIDGVQLWVAGAVTKGLEGNESTDYVSLKKAGVVALSDDGRPVMNDAIMREALKACAQYDLLFMQHAEDLNLSHGAPMNLGPTSERLGVEGQPGQAEWLMVKRDLEWVKETGARYHVLHASTKETLQEISKAKAEGLCVSAEVTPHHLILTDEACSKADPNTKMNPPLRSDSDRRALIQAVQEGLIDAVASDHAPHSEGEKNLGFCKAPFGVVGLETAFSVLLTLVHQGVISLERAISLMTKGPAQILKKSGDIGTLLSGSSEKNLCLFDPTARWRVESKHFYGKSKNSAFLETELIGRVVATFLRGRLRYFNPL